MKKLIIVLIAVMLCVSCQQPPVKTGIELKTGSRYYAEAGSSEMAPEILVKYSDGSTVEAVGTVDTSARGLTDISYENFRIENGAYIYDIALSEIPFSMGEKYNSKYVLLKAKDGGYNINKKEYEADDSKKKEAMLITAENLYILGEEGAELRIELINQTNVIRVTEGSLTLDGIKFSIIEPFEDDNDNEVNMIIAEKGSVSVKNCDISGINVNSLLNPEEGTEEVFGMVGIYSQNDALLSLTDNTFREMYIVDNSSKTDVIKDNKFENAYIAILDSEYSVEGNVFNNDSLGYGIIYDQDLKLDEETVNGLSVSNGGCKVLPFNNH